MNIPMIKKLVLKDFYFARLALVLYLAGAATSIGMMLSGFSILTMIGGIALVAAIMSFGIFLVFATVINERKHGTLPFIMSLPVSYKDYTAAKVIANVAAFFVPWMLLALVILTLIGAGGQYPQGVIPFFWILQLELFIGYLIILAVAIVTESEGWTVAVMAVVNTAFSIVFLAVSKVGAIKETISGPEAVWSAEALAIIGGEVGLIALIIALVFFFQARKTSFI